MAKADGEIIIDTAIRTDGMKEGGKEIEAAMRRAAKSVSDIGQSAKIALQKQTDAFVKQNQLYAQQEEKVDALKRKLEEMSEQKAPTQEYTEATKEVQKLETALDKAVEKQIKFLDTGGNKESRTFKSMEYDIEKLSADLSEAKAKKDQLESSGAAYTPVDTSAIEQKLIAEKQKLLQMNSALNTSYDSLRNKVESYGGTVTRLTGIKAKLLGIFERLKNSVKSVGSAMVGLNKKTEKNNSTFVSNLKTILKYTLGIRSLYILFNKARGAIVEGFQNLAQYSGESNKDISMLVSSLTQLKNSLATAFAPILSVVAPILSKFIGMISQAVTYVGMFFAALTGKGTFTKAVAVQQDYAAGLEKTGSAAKDAAKELKGYLSPIDEINKIEKQDTSDTSGGGAGAGGVSPGQMFETVPIESKIKDFADKVKKILSEMFAPLKEAWAIYGPSIKQSLNLILQDFIDFGKRIGLATIDWFKNLDWKPLLSSVDILLKAFEPLFDLILDAGVWAWENVLLPFGKWAIEKEAPALLILLGNAFKYVTAVLKRLQPVFQWLWDNLIKDLGTVIGEVIVGITTSLSGLLEFLTGVFSGDWEKAMSGLKTIAKGLQQAVMAVFTYIQNNIMIPFDNFLQGVFAIDWIKYFGIFGYVIEGFMKSVKNIWDGIKTAFEGFLTFLDGTFSGNWSQALSGLLQIFKGIFDSLVGCAQIPINIIIGIMKGFLAIVISIFEYIQNNIMIPFDNFLQNIFVKDWTTQFGVLGGVLNGFMKVISDIWAGTKKAFDGFMTFLRGTFSGNWKQALDGLAQVFKGMFDSLVGFAKSPINIIIGLVNGMISGVAEGINAVIDLINSIHFTVPDWVPIWGGKSFDPGIRKISPPKIPYLATGAVIPPNAPFMAMLGDQKNGNNLEMPENLLRRIVREETGGNKGGTYRFTGQINRRVLFDEMITEAKLIQSMNGNNPFELA